MLLVKRRMLSIFLIACLWVPGMGLSLTSRHQEQELAEADRLSVKMSQLFEAKRYDEAISLAEKVIAINEKALGPEHTRVAYSLKNLAAIYRAKEQPQRAEPLYERAMAIFDKNPGADPIDVAFTLHNLAQVYTANGHYGSADSALQRALPMFEKILGEQHPHIANVLNDQGHVSFYMRDDKRTESLLVRALTINEKVFGPNSSEVATTVNNLAELYRVKGDYVRAEPQYQRALIIYEKILGREHSYIAVVLGNLGSVYMLRGEYARAEPLVQRALAIRKKAFGPEHREVAKSLNSLASLYSDKADFITAESLYKEALAMLEKVLHPAHPEVAHVCRNLAQLYDASGDYVSAESFLYRALTIDEKTFGLEHPNVAASAEQLGRLYMRRGEHDRAEPLLQRALAISKRVFGPEHREVADSLSTLAAVHDAKGDYKSAESLSQNALAIFERSLGPDSPHVAAVLSTMAIRYAHQGDLARAERMLLRALSIDEQALGQESFQVAPTLNNLGYFYRVKGDYGAAELYYRRSLAIRERALGVEHPEVAETLNNLAVILALKGDDQAARFLYERALDIVRKTFGHENIKAAALVHNLAAAYEREGDYARALSFLQQGGEIDEKNIARLLNTGSQQHKQYYLDNFYLETASAVSLHVQNMQGSADAARLACTLILQRKGRALDAMSNQLSILRQRASPQDQKLLDQFGVTLSRLATLLVNQGQFTPEVQRAEVARLEAEQERLEDIISRRSAEFQVITQPATFDAVRQAVPSDAALVELFVYHPIKVKAKTQTEVLGASHYVAYIVRRDDVVPQWVDLGEAAGIDVLIDALRKALRDPRNRDFKQPVRKLDERVMRPIRKLLGATQRIFLAPDGDLNLIPFAALVDENGRYLIENYSINYLTSGRDLLRLQVADESRDGPKVFGDPLYDLQASVAPSPTNPRLTNAGAATNPEKQLAQALYTQTYKPLPGTRDEAAAIARLFPDSTLFTQAQATEAAIKGVNRPLVLHVATHGFFLSDQPQSSTKLRRSLSFETGSDTWQSVTENRENPLLRSGLVFSGVNQRTSGPGEDGVLTALEVAGLDLRQTKLVVLSACETGLGEVKNGAGVYGLRRALVLAGSETQVMTLWKVSDAGTRDFMVAYYARLQKGEGRTEALRQVQLAMVKNGLLPLRGAVTNGPKGKRETSDREGENRTKDYSHPYYWAAFIQSGDWRSMKK